MAEVVALTGQSFEQAWRMTWPEYKALSKFWGEWPPAMVSLAVLAKLAPQLRGSGPEDTTPDADLQTQNMAALEGLIGSPPPQ